MSDISERDLRRDQIALMVEDFYNQNEKLHIAPYGYYAERVLAKYLDSDLSLDAIRKELSKLVEEKKKEIDSQFDPTVVEKNHRFIYKKLKELIRLLNRSGADYHLAGALSAYIYYGEESERVHDDIDIHINERDMNKLKNACEAMGLTFYDKRLNSPRVLINGIPAGRHEVTALSDKSDFHVGAFCFERMPDGTIISKGYYHDDNNKSCAREVVLSPELAKEIYLKKPIYFHDLPVFITSPEYLYSLKNYTRTEKDLVDIAFLEKHIDRNKLANIRILSKDPKHKFVQCVRVTKVPPTSKINRKAIENDNSELSKMLVGSSADDATKASVEVPKKNPPVEVKPEVPIDKPAEKPKPKVYDDPPLKFAPVSPMIATAELLISGQELGLPDIKEGIETGKKEESPAPQEKALQSELTSMLEDTRHEEKPVKVETLEEDKKEEPEEEEEFSQTDTIRAKDLIAELDSFHDSEDMRPKGLGEFKTYFKKKKDQLVDIWNESDEDGFTTKDNILIVLILAVGLTLILLLILTK